MSTQSQDLARSTQPVSAYVPVIDGLRGIAVLWIVLGHVRWRLHAPMPTNVAPFDSFVTSSYFGVDLLFIVSGFVLFLPAVVNNGSLGDWKTYALRRAARIIPAFYVAMLLSYAVAAKLGEVRGGVGAWLSHLLFLSQHAHPREDLGFGVNSPIWTMSVEVIFYALLPLVASRYARHPLAGLGIAIGLTETWHQLALHVDSVVSFLGLSWSASAVDQAQYRMVHAFPSFATQFAVGMTAAWMYARVQREPARDDRRRLFPAVAAVSLLGIIAVANLRGWETAHGFAGPFDHWVRTIDRSLLFGGLVLATALSGWRTQWLAGNSASRFLGTVCYGTYLSHLPLIYLLIPALGLGGAASSGDALLLSAIVLPLSIAVGIVSYTFLEEPFRRLVRQRTSRRRRTVRFPRVAIAGARG